MIHIEPLFLEVCSFLCSSFLWCQSWSFVTRFTVLQFSLKVYSFLCSLSLCVSKLIICYIVFRTNVTTWTAFFESLLLRGIMVFILAAFLDSINSSLTSSTIISSTSLSPDFTLELHNCFYVTIVSFITLASVSALFLADIVNYNPGILSQQSLIPQIAQ